MNIVIPVSKVSNYIELSPLIAAMHASNNHFASNSLPTNTEGTVQQNAEQQAHPKMSLYNSHGILVNNKDPNSLIAYA